MIVMTAIDSRNRFANTLKELAAKKTLEKITTEEIVKAAGVPGRPFTSSSRTSTIWPSGAISGTWHRSYKSTPT